MSSTPKLRHALVAAAMATTLVITGCSEAEDAATDTTSAAKDAGEKAEDAAKDAGEKAEDAAKDATSEAKEAGEDLEKDAKEATDGDKDSSSEGDTVEITHAYGTDTYPVAPERVMAMGQTAIDNLLALGIEPDIVVISAREKDIPWQQGKLGDAEVIEVAGFKDFPVEKFAAAEPDLIVGDKWRISEERYPDLKAIAPTIGPASNDPAKIGWREQTENLGKIFGKEEQAQKVIDDDEKLFADAREEMPGLEGKTGIISQYIGDSKQFGVVADPTIPGSAWLYDLGMEIPEAIVNSENQEYGRTTLSAENIDMMAADFMIIGPRGATVEDITATPGFNELPQVVSGATRVTDNPSLLQAINQPSALSRAYALEELHPELEAAAGS